MRHPTRKSLLVLLTLFLGLVPSLASAAETVPSPSSSLQGDWRGIDVWADGSAGGLFTLLGRGDGVDRLAETLAHRVAAFEAITGLQGPVEPLVILWLQDEATAEEFGGASGWVRQLESTGSDAALGGDVWITIGSAGELAPKLASALDQHLVLAQTRGLPAFLQIALLDLLSAARVEPGPRGDGGERVVVEPIDEYVEVLDDLDEWDSLISAAVTPWSQLAPALQQRLRPQGWAFMHYLLLEHENGSEVLHEALDSTRLGAVFPAALQAALIRPPDKLQTKVVRPYALDQLATSGPKIELPRSERLVFTAGLDRILVEFGRLQQLRERPGDASALFEQAEAMGGSSAGRAAAGLAYQARQRGDHAAAVLSFARAAAADPVSAHWLREQARSILDRTAGEPDDASTANAIELLRASLDLDPRLAETWTQLAVAYRRPKAEDADWLEWTETKYERAPEERKGHVAVPLYALYEAAGRTGDAARLSDRHPELRQLPTFTESGGEIVRVGGSVEGGVIDAEGAIQLMKEGRYAEALAAFEALRARSQGVETWNEELERQIEDLRRVVAHNRFTEAYNEAARLFNEGRYRDAANLLDPVVNEVQDEARRARGEKLLAQSLEWAEKHGQ